MKKSGMIMHAAQLIKEIILGTNPIHLLIYENRPMAQFDQKIYPHLSLLVQDCPLLSNSVYIHCFAEVSNFLWKGTDFQWIENVGEYQKHYIAQVELEKQYSGDVFPYRLTDYKIFDIAVMHPPKLEDDQLSYFVYNRTNGLPYRVVCPFPYYGPSTLVHYQILPIKE